MNQMFCHSELVTVLGRCCSCLKDSHWLGLMYELTVSQALRFKTAPGSHQVCHCLTSLECFQLTFLKEKKRHTGKNDKQM